VTVSRFAVLRQATQGILAAYPLTTIHFRRVTPENLSEFLSWKFCERVQRLDLSNRKLGDVAISQLFEKPGLSQLRKLSLIDNLLTTATMHQLVEWPRLASLKLLDLSFNSWLIDDWPRLHESRFLTPDLILQLDRSDLSSESRRVLEARLRGLRIRDPVPSRVDQERGR
jgi:hypothetical protein